jgi:hypothetical protein
MLPHSVGGTLTGLPSAAKLTLLNNGADALTLATDGTFTFATRVSFNSGYAVTVGTTPFWQSCAVSNPFVPKQARATLFTSRVRSAARAIGRGYELRIGLMPSWIRLQPHAARHGAFV